MKVFGLVSACLQRSQSYWFLARLVYLLPLATCTSLAFASVEADGAKPSNEKLFKAIGLSSTSHIPIDPRLIKNPIVIAVVDDGFNTQHTSLNKFIWSNPNENANNGIDDDNNGAIDDVFGWDVSDQNENITPPAHTLSSYYHGTFSASIITEILKAKLGLLTEYPINLMLVKAVSDSSNDMLVKEGYRGIQYALENSAEIISNSWSGGILDDDGFEILNEARNNQLFVVNAVGNFTSATPSEPANHPSVFGVAAVDHRGKITDKSNYGEEVDMSAVGKEVWGASVTDNQSFTTGDGTSVAVPMVAATAGLMKMVNRDISPNEISACLKNTAKPIDEYNATISGKLGAGLLQVDAAIDCAANLDQVLSKTVYHTPEGSISTRQSKGRSKEWIIAPVGDYAGIRFENSLNGKAGKSKITFYEYSESVPKSEQDILWAGALTDLPVNFGLKSSKIRAVLQGRNLARLKFSSDYKAILIDSEKKYCSNRQVIDVATTISDGSELENYVPLSDCEWLIEAKQGKSIHLKFTELDIDESDKLYLFKGDQRRQRDLLATISGNKLPPKMIIKHGRALLWLVSEKENEGQGFSAEVSWHNVIED